jgi:hypothetical protein
MRREIWSNGRRRAARAKAVEAELLVALRALNERLTALELEPASPKRDMAIELLKLEQLRILEAMTRGKPTTEN